MKSLIIAAGFAVALVLPAEAEDDPIVNYMRYAQESIKNARTAWSVEVHTNAATLQHIYEAQEALQEAARRLENGWVPYTASRKP